MNTSSFLLLTNMYEVSVNLCFVIQSDYRMKLKLRYIKDFLEYFVDISLYSSDFYCDDVSHN